MTRLSFMRRETLATRKRPCALKGQNTGSFISVSFGRALRCFFRLHVDLAGKLSKLFVGGFFLVQSLLQQVNKV